MKRLLGCVALVLLAGCGNSQKDTSGVWSGNCVVDGDSSSKATYDNSDGDTFTLTSHLYSDTTCTTETMYITISGTQEIGDAVSGIDDAYNINRTYTSITATPVSSSTADSLNSASFCDATNWTANTAKDVAGKTCGGEDIPAANAVDYDIMKIDASGDSPKLYFGDESGGKDGKTSAARPTSLDTGTVYTQQ